MKFVETALAGTYLIEIEPVADERGFFARTWCEREFQERGLNTKLAQCSVSFNKRRGTVRGMHFQDKPYEEAKLIRCTQGSVYDVLVDLRRDSPSFKRWHSAILSAENRAMLYVPPGVAHGFQTLADDTEVFYQISEFYHPDCTRGIRWNDPAFAIQWPEPVEVISVRDQSYPDFEL